VERADSRPPSSAEALPTVPGDVRDVFGLPLLNEEGAATKAAATKASTGSDVRQASAAAKPAADAHALFDDGRPRPARKPSAAAARSKARRCPTCGGVVPVGMSLCSTCGLDLETGTRVTLEDDLAPPPLRKPPLPLAITILGGICFLSSVIFTIVTTSLWLRGFEGFQYFVPIALFAVFAAIQFLRQKSVRLLLMALSFGLAIDTVALIAMPIYRANAETAEAVRTTQVDEPDKAGLVIPSVVERLDTQSLSLGIGLVAVYAGVVVYLLSPQVRRHFR
jgi:hypothetical protein